MQYYLKESKYLFIKYRVQGGRGTRLCVVCIMKRKRKKATLLKYSRRDILSNLKTAHSVESHFPL